MLKSVRFMLIAVLVFSVADVGLARDCMDNDDCSPRKFCEKAPGDCDGVGVCSRRPRNCLDVYDPVCGCDGATYSNACYAARAGVSVDYEGECASPGACYDNGDCVGGDEYCAKAVGDCDGEGTCEVRPPFCLDIYDPVCGCDGRTYGNACYAAQVGVNVAFEGPCEEGCLTNADCGGLSPLAFGEYCRKDAGDCDGVGACTARPEMCLDVWDPVCGCDGNTYSNDCYAARAGVNVANDGSCGSDRAGQTCTTNMDCGGGFGLFWLFEYCRKDVGDCDGEGVCSPRPMYCLDVWRPVCGCDGAQYSNACYAARSGVSVESMDGCPY